jgi:hypothetical protein
VAARFTASTESQTKFEVGDMVLISYPYRPPASDKLTSGWRVPLLVVRVEGQTYFCQDLVNLTINPFFIDRD